MTSLDDISYKLGELSNGQTTLVERANRQEDELVTIRSILTDVNAKLTPMVRDVAEMKPDVDHYKGVRKRAAWVHSVIVGVASVCGGSMTAYLFKKFGG